MSSLFGIGLAVKALFNTPGIGLNTFGTGTPIQFFTSTMQRINIITGYVETLEKIIYNINRICYLCNKIDNSFMTTALQLRTQLTEHNILEMIAEVKLLEKELALFKREGVACPKTDKQVQIEKQLAMIACSLRVFLNKDNILEMIAKVNNFENDPLYHL